MRCRACGSEKLGEYPAEIALHLAGRKNIDRPAVLVFPKIQVCVECGVAEFVVPEAELHLLVEGNSSASAAGGG